MLYYVERNSDGAIVALYGLPQEGRTDPEPLPDTDPEVAAILNPLVLPTLTARHLDGDAVVIDMERARDIHRDRLRAARRPMLEALDAEWFRAAESGDSETMADVAYRKQALRDAPGDPRIEWAETVEELEALTIEELIAE